MIKEFLRNTLGYGALLMVRFLFWIGPKILYVFQVLAWYARGEKSERE